MLTKNLTRYMMDAQYILNSPMNSMFKSYMSDCQRWNHSANILKKVSDFLVACHFWFKDLFPRNETFSLEFSALAFGSNPEKTFTTMEMTVGQIRPLLQSHCSCSNQSWECYKLSKVVLKYHCGLSDISWSLLRGNWIDNFLYTREFSNNFQLYILRAP